MICVISSKKDSHIEFVQRHIKNKMLVIDPSELVAERFCGASYEISGTGPIKIVWGSEDLSKCTAVWFRKPDLISREEYPVIKKYKKYARAAYSDFFAMIYGLLKNALWISDKYAIQRADNKILQLEVARQEGLNVPPTLITNNPSKVSQFRREIGNIVTKPIRIEVTYDKKNHIASGFYATSILENQSLDLEGLKVAPAIFQGIVENKTDIRIIAVGKKLFSCAITKTHPDNYIDWRTGISGNNINCTKWNIPEDLKLKLIRMLERLNLRFGAFDFALDNKTGGYWFLELNPNGQWAFIEQLAGLPIAETLAKVLTNEEVC